MPAFSTHYIFALEMMPKLRQKADFKLNENAVFAGTQGPDIFFFHRIFPWLPGKSLRKAGSVMHRSKPGNILDAFSRYCKTSSDPSVSKSYVYGFILHYALDRKCHPYVYYLQNRICENEKINPFSAHNIVELSADSFMLNTHLGIKLPKKFETAAVFDFTVPEKNEIAHTLASVSESISPPHFTSKDAETALEDMKAAQNILLDCSGKKEKIFIAAEKLFMPFTNNFKISSFLRTDDLEKAKKYVNINNEIWESPFEKGKRRESFDDLFELSKTDAEDMIVKWNNGLSGRDITRNLSFLTGVEIK